MKYTYFLLLIVFLSCSEKHQNGFIKKAAIQIDSPNILLKVSDMPQGGTVALVGSYLGENYLVDSSRVEEGGIVRFQRNTPYRQGLVFALFDDDSAIQMLITEDQTFSISTSKEEPEQNALVSDSPENELFYNTLKIEKNIRKEINAISQKIEVGGDKKVLEKQLWEKIDERYAYLENLKTNFPDYFFTKYKLAAQATDMREYDRAPEKLAVKPYEFIFKTGFWDQVDFADERLLATPVIPNKMDQFMNQLVTQESDSIIKYGNQLIDKSINYPSYFKYFTNWMLLNYEPSKSNLMDPEAVYANLIDRYFTKDKVTWIDSMQIFAFRQKAFAMSQSIMGKQGGNISGSDMNGQIHSIYNKSSKYVALYIFNPKCGLCKEETPILAANYADWKNKGIEILAVATDSNEEELKTYIEENDIKFPVLLDSAADPLYPKYYVNRTPELYLLDKDRIIIGKNLQANLLEPLIKYTEKSKIVF